VLLEAVLGLSLPAVALPLPEEALRAVALAQWVEQALALERVAASWAAG
jgi:hypothetical protein